MSTPVDADPVLAHEDENAVLLAVAVGNSRVRIGVFKGRELLASSVFVNPAKSDGGSATAEIAGLLKRANAQPGAALIASVHSGGTEAMARAISDACPAATVYHIGRDIPIPMRTTVDEPGQVGQDRYMNAIAAFRRAEQATVVVDAGTAVTVDFVDGTGTFHGGVIAPGLGMMLSALHEHTDSLPETKFEPLDESQPPQGRNTSDAMRRGAVAAVRGLVRECLDRYAEHYGAYPQVIATGGDAGILEATELVEHIAPDLQLMGIQACAEAALREATAEQEGDDGDMV